MSYSEYVSLVVPAGDKDGPAWISLPHSALSALSIGTEDLARGF